MADIEETTTTNGHISDNESHSDGSDIDDVERPENVILDRQPKSIMKKNAQAVPMASAPKPELPEQPDFSTLNVKELTPLSEPIIARQATINIGTIGKLGIWWLLRMPDVDIGV